MSTTDTHTDDKLGDLIARMDAQAEQRKRTSDAEWQAEREYDWILDKFVIPIEDLYVKTAVRLGERDDGPPQSLLDAVRHLANASAAIMSAKTSLVEERAYAMLLDAAREAQREAAATA